MGGVFLGFGVWGGWRVEFFRILLRGWGWEEFFRGLINIRVGFFRILLFRGGIFLEFFIYWGVVFMGFYFRWVGFFGVLE